MRAEQSEVPWFHSVLRCPDCAGMLITDQDVVGCSRCEYRCATEHDLRPRNPLDIMTRNRRGPALPAEALLRSIDLTPPAITYAGPDGNRDSRELLSEIAERLPRRGDVLDLGCGPRGQCAPLSHLGFRYLGLDYSDASADRLADAHALPLADASLDGVLAYAVLEHLHNPFVAIAEVARVLRPGGWFIGTVSQGEPFHSSYFHHTPWALLSLVQQSPGLSLRRLWPSSDTLASLAAMGRYPRLLRLPLAWIDRLNSHLPWLSPRKMRWPLVERQLDRLYRASSLCFAIQKASSFSPGEPG